MTLELNNIYNTDCLLGMKEIPDNSIDLIIESILYSQVYYILCANLHSGTEKGVRR